MKPTEVFGRESEWQALERFATGSEPAGGLAVVYGRRRQGKSFLLRRLASVFGGLYFQATTSPRALALADLGRAVAAHRGIASAGLRLDSWEEAIGALPGGLVVIDELPFLLAHSPEVPSVLQRAIDDATAGIRPPLRLVLCGSALAIMSGLLSGRQPLRGRATVELRLPPFDFREAGAFWGAANHETAFRLHALFGGTPGYRPLVGPAPAAARLGRWLAGNVLSPSHALFREDEYVLREDPRVTDDGLYLAVLRALAEGATTQSQVAARLGRPRESLNHALDVLLGATLVSRRDDLFRQRRPTLTVADPLVRFIQLVVAPNRPLLEEGAAEAVWASAQTTVRSQIEGPHFEELARIWVRRYAAEASTGGPCNAVGSAVIDDPAGQRTHDIDVLAIAGSPSGSRTVTLVGEAKATSAARGTGDLRRLEHLRSLLTAQGRRADKAKLALFARSGFTTELRNLAERRRDIELVDLARLYEGS